MTKTKSKSWNIYKGISLYLRNDSPRYYDWLRIDGKYCRRCLNTENGSEEGVLTLQLPSHFTSPSIRYRL
jgi:hypothetical protein